MNAQDPNASEPLLFTRRPAGDPPTNVASDNNDAPEHPSAVPKYIGISLLLIVLIIAGAFFGARLWARHVMQQSLPQLDGTLGIAGLSAPVTVQRDNHGIPHIHAANLDDLIVAQGYITAQDRLWQMETLRRHAAGSLAEILGARLIPHDRTQRTLQIRNAADRAIASLPPDQLHSLELYSRGVNASIAAQRDRLPIEFRLLQFTPAPWTPRDSILVYLVMFQDLTSRFSSKLDREFLSAHLQPALLDDLYPVGSWRDHPPAQPVADLTNPATDPEQIPLDESQTKLSTPATADSLLALRQSLRYLNLQPTCTDCMAGSNNWVVSGAHTASGKPLLSNDMHLSLAVPGIWYEADLQTPQNNFHVTGVSLPGTPLIIVGHNDHVAWGFTNLGADVQDLYVERTRVIPGGTEFQSPDGTWHPVVYQHETIHVRRGPDVNFDTAATRHGDTPTPIISGLATDGDKRTIALRWTIYDPTNLTDPFLAVNSATDGASLVAAFANWGGPSQNLVYADDRNHIGYHAVGKIPLRGSVTSPTPLSFVPVSGLDPTRDWAGYIPFDQLPQVVDPPNGVIATANARITPDNYPLPITLDWEDPYRNERIWKVLTTSKNLTPADMLKLQADIYSDVDKAIAQKLTYAIDHADLHASADAKRLHAAADILRDWNGNVDANSAAPAIVDAARAALWPMILTPKLGPKSGNSWELYSWGEKAYAEEQLIMHTPARWLPQQYPSWDALLTAAVEQGLIYSHAPSDLAQWHYGSIHTINIEHPIFAISPIIPAIIGIPVGIGPHPLSGDGTTVLQSRGTLGPSERFTADLSNLDHSTLNIVLGQSGDPASPWFLDQWPAYYNASTFQLPFTPDAVQQSTTHTLTLTPQ